MRGDHAGLLKIEAECARRVRSSTMSMIEEMDGGGHSLGYMVRYRRRAVLLRGSFQSRFESILRVTGWRIRGTEGQEGLSKRARIS
jgi:hypothetical protein